MNNLNWPEKIYLVPQLLQGDYFLKELPDYTDDDIFIDYRETSQKLSYPNAAQVEYIREDLVKARELAIIAASIKAAMAIYCADVKDAAIRHYIDPQEILNSLEAS